MEAKAATALLSIFIEFTLVHMPVLFDKLLGEGLVFVS